MEPHQPTPEQAQETSRPSRPPPDSTDEREAPKRGTKRPGRFDDAALPEAKRVLPETRTSIAKFETEFEAEYARRKALTPDQRLKEDGDRMREKMEADPVMVVALEVSRSQRAGCRANDDCFYKRAGASSGNAIETDYRICVRGVDNNRWFGRTKHYYHVACFSGMIDPKDLLPSKFKMDGSSGRWGIMVERWFQHGGCINLDKIAAFLKELTAYEEEHRGWSARYGDWNAKHNRSCKDKDSECKCPTAPQAPQKPSLEDYTTGDGEVCTLLDVLKHPLVDKRGEWWMTWLDD